MMLSRRVPTRLTKISVLIIVLCLTLSAVPAQNRKAEKATVQADDLQKWLTYLASDELEGRATFSEGLGLAAAYLAEQLRSWGVKPGGDNGSYFQRVRVLGVKKSANRSTLTVEVNGQTRTFKEGEGITFPRNVGGKRSFTVDQVEFLGYGLDAPLANQNDYAGKDVKGKAVVYLGANGPQGLGTRFRRALGGRARYATDQRQAVASIGVGGGPAGERQGGGGAGGGGASARGGIEQEEFTTTQRLDHPLPPNVIARDDFFEFLFSNADVKYAELKEKAAKQEPLPSFTLKGVKLSFNLDADYQIVRTQFTRNVIGVVEGTDPKLKDTYVTFGAHYDHQGYAEGEIAQGARQGAVGRVKQGALEDRIWNGADDDGSGTATLLGVAKAFATGPKPKRSLMFLWFAGEERGLWGSRFHADYPTAPLEKIVANLNMDMVGRNRDDKPEEANSVYLVGSDRISTELHNLTVEANAGLVKPLKLDFEMNDPTDLEQVYYRSDHYSYAAKGIPIVFFTTGLHPDYHVNTDSVEKINFEKMARIGQLVYEAGRRVANLDNAPARDNRGPRVGKGSDGKIVEKAVNGK
ncbi:MAG TPA: M28 family peptidase [Blastocatellia bacterium]|nr:M28 family peptidase [Blastocatellia bacterium]